jgi:phosphoenolpyruvate carboxykinase (ATP)
VDVPVGCPGVPETALDPRATWADGAAYDEQAARLARMFAENFGAFEGSVDAEVLAAGPGV